MYLSHVGLLFLKADIYVVPIKRGDNILRVLGDIKLSIYNELTKKFDFRL